MPKARQIAAEHRECPGKQEVEQRGVLELAAIGQTRQRQQPRLIAKPYRIALCRYRAVEAEAPANRDLAFPKGAAVAVRIGEMVHLLAEQRFTVLLALGDFTPRCPIVEPAEIGVVDAMCAEF